jgi:GT2 family glycosyltransferase
LPDSIFLHLHHDTYLDDLPDRSDLGWKFFATYNVSAKAAMLRRHGGFDTSLKWYEDTELGLRLEQDGMRILLVKDALGYHYHPIDEGKYLHIAESDGSALAFWYARNPELLPYLMSLGLQSARLGTLEPRHKLADLAINQITWPLWLGLARALSGPRRAQAISLYRKLFQWRKRQAIEARFALESGARGKHAN